MMFLPIGLLSMKTPRIEDFDPNAKTHQLKSPLDGMPAIEIPPQQSASLLANQQTSKETNQQASKPVKKLADKEENQHTSLPANQRTSKLLKKFGSYLTPESIKKLKLIATERDVKDYEILQDAVDMYLEALKK